MTSHRTCPAPAIAPGPDDSDFLDSESEGGFNDSVAEHNQNDGLPTMSQASHRSHQMTEMEMEMAAVATPMQSQTTATSYFTTKQIPKPATKIMQMTSNFSFTYFSHKTSPEADDLNKGNGRQAAGLPLDINQGNTQSPTKLQQKNESEKDVTSTSSIAPHLPSNAFIHWFSIDNELVYLSFFDDWGPLNVAMFYRFCLHLHHLIGSMQEKAASAVADPQEAPEVHLILYTTDQPRSKANAALLAAMYAMVCGDMTPADAFHPISELELVPFRDAGYGRADFYLTVQDILYGIHRAVTEKLLDLMTFDLDEYETYEQVQNGDWNWITPNIIAFASPNDKEYVADLRAGTVLNGRATPGLRRPLNATFTKTIQYFKKNNIKLVVRLNNPLYDSRVFENEGIQHVDMYFDDGSNPSEAIIRDFIERANAVISAGGAIAVHCKAGLGRTGVLIGAYLAYRHGFSASESIGFMRIMRPGCVVGPQQHFMYQESSNWIRWREQDDAQIALQNALEKQKVELVGASKRRKSDEMEAGSSNEGNAESEVDIALGQSPSRQAKKAKREVVEVPRTPKKTVDVVTAEEDDDDDDEEKTGTALPGLLTKPTPCVGQPRKSPSPSRKRAAQAQAPATIARMGGLTSTSRGRIVSSSSHRSFSGSSFSRSLQQMSQSQESQQENTGQEQKAPSSTTPSRVLADARRINIQIAIDEGEVALSTTPRAADWNAGIEVKASVAKNNQDHISHSRSKSGGSVVDDGLFVQGWKSPEPPATYIDRIATNSPARSTAGVTATVAILAAPSTPTSPSAPLQGVRASPQIREKFGLRETASQQNTPRSRKDLGVMMTSSDSNGSTSSGSLTSRDAPGSEDEHQLRPGPMTTTQTASKPSQIALDNVKQIKQTVQQQSTRAPAPSSRVVSRERVTTTTTSTRTVSNSSSSSASKTTPAIRSINSTTRRVQPAAAPTTTTTGRVAAARDQLTQRNAAQVPNGSTATSTAAMSHKTSLKRSRVHSPDLAQTNEQMPKTLVSSTIANRFNVPCQVKPGVVPRFAAATAASTAKSQQQQLPLGDHTNRFQRGGPVHTIATKTFNVPSLSTAPSSTSTIARLNGRNVRRRRSSIS